MPRNLIVCIDGTWNSSAEKSEQFSEPTNVWRISQHLLNDGITQRVVYVPGVGTTGFFDKVIGGVWGKGTTQRICDGYRFLCMNYEPGDIISMFGFSRGAFAVRAIIGLLINFGVLRSNKVNDTREAVRLYRSERTRVDDQLFIETHCYEVKPEIRFVGVWDTVVRYGPLLAPIQDLLMSVRGERFGLYDHHLPQTVRYFCHALALDERRAAYWPWRGERLEQSPLDQVEEMWFTGAHSDIGGGYRDSRLSELPLEWISERAANAGLVFQGMPNVGEESYLAPPHHSRQRIWWLLPSRRRIVQESDHIHYSVERKMQLTEYRPAAKLSEQMYARLTGCSEWR